MKTIKIYFLLAGSLVLFITGCVAPKAVVKNTPVPNTSSAAPVIAERANLEGKWQYTMSNPDHGTLTGNLMVQRGGVAGYSGYLMIKEMRVEAETIISKAEIKGQNFVYQGVVKTPQGNIPFELHGTIKGPSMEAQNKVQLPEGLAVFKVSATRQ